MTQHSLSEWLSLLEARHPTEIEFGLDRIGRVAVQLGLSHSMPEKKVITVAGTNGKGSCVAALESILLAAGYRVGSYTSPHFIDYNERICLNAQPVSDQTICAAFERIESVRGDISLTYFEFGTLAALLIMDQADLDIVVLEVGLGGRLDAVNLIDADIAIVTSLALDHQDWLGDDLNQIAAEKAAIARSGRPLIYGDVTPVPGLLVAAGEIGAQLLLNGRDFSLTELNVPANTSLPPCSVACAVQAVRLIDPSLPNATIEQGLQAVTLLGRFQQVDLGGVRLILDVAHNPQATELLAQRLLAHRLRTQKLSSVDQKIIAVSGVMADKDISGMFLPLVPLVRDWFFCDIPGQHRAADARKLSALLYNVSGSNEVNVVERKSPVAALQAALAHANIGDSVVVFGSFFTVGPVLEWLNQVQKGSVSGG
ncbi:MAG: folylpolyglutamate synthase/dihydrofolate synthase family protein [Porticoccus sp.]|nr:folylpolyglutamate synthase/dihydrofolate synthase family protein [Porticoccus sp.]